MLIPEPESDLSLNIIVLASDIIHLLHESKDYLMIDDLMLKFLERNKKRTHSLFFDSLTFLYTLGIVIIKIYKVRLKKFGFTQKTLF